MQKFLSWAAVLLGMALIFSFSSQVAAQSNQLSTGVTEIVIKVVEKIVPNVEFDQKSLNNTFRKGAHFFAYLILGVLVGNALRRSGLHGYRWAVLALGICFLYAITDEVHQLYVPGRGGQLRDVFLDSAGAGIGILLYWAGIYKNKSKVV